jgi:ribosomal protein S18 acetylase RimI-like enzyme
MPQCAYCESSALHQDRQSRDFLCPAHARLEVAGPRRAPAPGEPLTIRAAIPDDRPAIARLADYFWGELEVSCFDRSYRVDALPAFVACAPAEPGAGVDEIVGVVSYAREADAVNLVLLNVLPQWQGRGAGRDLVAAVVEAARVGGAARIIVATTNDDLPALDLYQRLGFTITGVCVGRLLAHHDGSEPGFAGIPVRDEIQMELRL